ncbi:MAG: hypothetical protein CSA15_13255 [Candidatus Delongbacteria bacterium]|nr:MAG: hypothetical protein CSA15_13255 [Candidatus Delongbacteria bacterium]
MQKYRKTLHTVYDIRYDLAWITKYVKQILKGELARQVRELVREVCKENEVEIIKGHVSYNYVHLGKRLFCSQFRCDNR